MKTKIRYKNPLLWILSKSKYVKIKRDFVDGRKVTRLIYDYEGASKMNLLTYYLMEILDRSSGFYGYRMTVSHAILRVAHDGNSSIDFSQSIK